MSLKLVQEITNRFDAVFDFQIQSSVLKLFRKAICVYYLIFLFSIFPSWNNYFGVNHVSFHAVHTTFDVFRLFNFFPFEIFWLLAFFLVIWHWAGSNTRLSSIALFLFQAALMYRNPFANSGEDYVLRILLFYSCFFPWAGAHKFFGSWAVRLAQINLVLIYFFCFYKQVSTDVAWLNGDAMYFLLINPSYNHLFPMTSKMAAHLSNFATYFFLLSQIIFPILIWFKKTRNFSIIGLILFHLTFGIMLSHFGFYSLIMLVGLVLFYQFKPKPL